MQIAILADIHGNYRALQAVLADIAGSGGVDGYWILGDLVAIGAEPIAVLEILTTLPNAQIIRGNTDRYVFAGDRPPPTLEEVRADLDLLPVFLEVEADFAWTQGALSVTGWLDWLKALPLAFEQSLPDGSRALGVHAAPGRDAGPGFHPGLSEVEILERLGDCPADLICAGHTHAACDLRAGGRRVINPGSLSNPAGADPRAGYAWLRADAAGYSIEHRQVAYDYRAMLTDLHQLRHPAADFIARHYPGASKDQDPIAGGR
jgi:putative phosphoesterase